MLHPNKFRKKYLLLLSTLFIIAFSGRIDAQIKVEFPKISGTENSIVLAPVKVGSLSEDKVTAFQFSLFYDKKKLLITGVDLKETLLESNPPVINADTAKGRIVIAWASATKLIGEGNLLKLKIKLTHSGKSTLTKEGPTGETFLFNAGSPKAIIRNGEVIIKSDEKSSE